MRSFMQTLCHCETNPSDSSPHSGVNTYLNFDLWGKLPLFSSFSLPAWWESRMFSSVRTFYHGATLWSLNPSLRLNGVTSNCIRQMPPLSSPRCKMHLGPEKKYVAPWTYCRQNPLLFHWMSFHVRFMCLCFLQPEKVFMHSSPSFIKEVIWIH